MIDAGFQAMKGVFVTITVILFIRTPFDQRLKFSVY